MSDISETFPMGIAGAAGSEGAEAIICISSDEDERLDCICEDSVDDLFLPPDKESEDNEIKAHWRGRWLIQSPYRPLKLSRRKSDATSLRSRLSSRGVSTLASAMDRQVAMTGPKVITPSMFVGIWGPK